MKVIVLAGGGTAGHIIPHIALYKYLEKYFNKICYIGSGKDIENRLIAPLNIEIHNINPPKFQRKFDLSNTLIPFKMLKAVKECKTILKNVNASIVFSKGGYCALPVCIAAKQLKIPIVMHESDLTLGLTNKITKNWGLLCTTFEETAEKNGGVFVGPPLKDDIFKISKDEARKKLNIKTNKKVLLVTGGSQGSKIINDVIYKNLDKICENFFVIHLTGKGNKPTYKAINDYLPIEFGDMKTIMPACDICLSRGGSTTLSELLICKIPTLVVPLEKNSRGDQLLNANYYYNKKVVLLRRENLLLKTIVCDLENLNKKSQLLICNMKKLNIKNGTEKLFNIIKEVEEKSQNVENLKKQKLKNKIIHN